MAALIRLFEDRDLEAVVRLWELCDLIRPWNPPKRDIDFCLSSGHGALFVTEADDTIVGTVMAGHDGHRGWVYYVAVSPPQRRTGLGRELMAHAENWLARQGVPKLMLMIRETNMAVQGFYEAIGYSLEPRIAMSKWLR
jgi:ribosomal protein S18 acetylase RimI-like enzyme